MDDRHHAMPHTIVDTMMRIDLSKPLDPGASLSFMIDWSYDIVEKKQGRARSSWEYFSETDNGIYEIAQWFPRLCPYTDLEGWQNKQFMGSSEFALEFGTYEVAITVPETFVVASTGQLQKSADVLTAIQRDRLRDALRSTDPVMIITPEEALANEQLDRQKLADGTRGTKTWRFHAHDVRDFAFAASPKFAWGRNGRRS